ncbi:MAG: hypothetical protein HRT90_08240 [Candidatus Margulisbacteria bacterium]|nr:hypothetical protein [Candidatus Margulisiibacteriota bacterium]
MKMTKGVILLWICVCGWLGYSLFVTPHTDYHISEIGSLPVVGQGRTKPLDSIARNALLTIRGKQYAEIDGKKMQPMAWLLRVLSRPFEADHDPIFAVHNPDVKVYLGFSEPKKKLYSYAELDQKRHAIITQADKSASIESQLRSPFQSEMVALRDRIVMYVRLKNSFFPEGVLSYSQYVNHYQGLMQRLDHSQLSNLDQEEKTAFLTYFDDFQVLDQMSQFLPIPPPQESDNDQWQSFGTGFVVMMAHKELSPMISLMAEALDAYRDKNSQLFNSKVAQLKNVYETEVPKESFKSHIESEFNRFAPFYKSILLYGFCFALVLLSWLLPRFVPPFLGNQLLILAFGVHSIGLILRMYLQGRPPVTNLYSSAVFIGWIAILVGLCMERIFRNRIGMLMSSVVGFATLIIAHHLSVQGDTLEMMQAVLDSNFWLSTHVVSITIGMGATFLAGFLGIYYMIRRLMPRFENKEKK